MILCFSGTGNSYLVAKELQQHIKGEIIMLGGDLLLDADKTLLEVPEGEPVIWVFPIYSWGVPPVLVPFIRRCKLKIKPEHSTPHYMVCTCGDDTGYADHQWAKLIGRRGWSPRGAFSVIMPNTYVLMKGFEVDPPDIADSKLKAMPDRVKHIAERISRNASGNELTRGSYAWFKSQIIYPWFAAFCMSPKPFHASEACVGCGLCATICPMQNIEMQSIGKLQPEATRQEGESPRLPHRPKWGCHCALCLRCYHICPTHAVSYGTATQSKGQKPVYLPR